MQFNLTVAALRDSEKILYGDGYNVIRYCRGDSHVDRSRAVLAVRSRDVSVYEANSPPCPLRNLQVFVCLRKYIAFFTL